MKPKLLIGCLSAWKYPKRRHRVLTTWMQTVQEYHLGALASGTTPRVDAVLLMAMMHAIQAERVGTYLILPVLEGYQFLPQKTREFCRWALTQPDWDYALKTDDDVRLDVDRLLDYDPGGADYIGPEWRDGVGYASGNGYLLSRRAAMVVAANLLEWEGCEDVLVGHHLREAGIPLTIDNDHFKVLTENNEAPGPDNHWIYCSPRYREPE